MINENALKDRLHIIAREKKLPFNACWKQLLLERFLARLASSAHTDKLIFKGGFLLSYIMEIYRNKLKNRVLDRAKASGLDDHN